VLRLQSESEVSPFRPNAVRAESIDRAVRARTAEGLAALGQGLSAQIPDQLAGIERLVSALHSAPVRPAVFALYSDLVLSVQREEEGSLLSTLAAADGLEATTHRGLKVVTISDDFLGPGLAARYVSQIDDDPIVPIRLLPLTSSELAQAENTLAKGLLLIHAADGQLAQEVANLVREIVFAHSGDGAPGFGGSTTFYLWGAVFLNVAEHPDPLSMAEGLVHEAAHTLLLGSTFGEALVENDPIEQFCSPLRQDPRPMDGIVHACFVLARMHYLMRRLVGSAYVDGEQARLASSLERYRHDFLVGDEVVAKHARFTGVGEALYKPAREYMLSV
jgi:hypothetical protein